MKTLLQGDDSPMIAFARLKPIDDGCKHFITIYITYITLDGATVHIIARVSSGSMKVPCIVVVFPRIAADPWKNHDQAEDATFKRARSLEPVNCPGETRGVRPLVRRESQVDRGSSCRVATLLSLLVMPVRVRGTSNLVTVTWGHHGRVPVGVSSSRG